MTLAGEVSPGQLGWVEDGPFFAYLRVDPRAVAADPARSTSWPAIHETDLPLGPLTVIDNGPARLLDVSITVEVPAGLEPGIYDVVYCNDPCTTGLGDLIGGLLFVGVDDCGDRCDGEFETAIGADEELRLRLSAESALDSLSPEAAARLRLQSELIARDTLESAILVSRRDTNGISVWVLTALVLGVTVASTVAVTKLTRGREEG